MRASPGPEFVEQLFQALGWIINPRDGQDAGLHPACPTSLASRVMGAQRLA